MHFADEITKDGEPTIETYAAVAGKFRPDQIVELTFLVGFWNMWNRFTDTIKIDPEERSHLVEDNLAESV